MAQRDEYLLGYRRAEQAQLQEQAGQLAEESSWLFDQSAIASGARVVDSAAAHTVALTSSPSVSVRRGLRSVSSAVMMPYRCASDGQ